MREALHQLTLALALPITVTGVWIARGDPGSVRPLETAAAYRAQLVELPLPQSRALRAPREASEWRRAPQESELPLPPRRRAALPEAAPAQPLALSPSGDRARAPESQLPARSVAPQPALASDPQLRAPRALPSTTATLPFVAGPVGAPAVARVSSTDAQAAEPSPAPKEAAPVAKLAAAASPPLATPTQPVSTRPLEPASNAPVVAAAGPLKPMVKAPVVVATPAAREKAPAPHVATAPRASTPQRERAATVVPTLRDVTEKLEKMGRRDEIAAAAPSPAVAETMREIDEALDLLLRVGARQPSILDAVLPTATVSPAPPELAAASPPSPAPIAPVSEAAPRLFGLPLQALEALAARFGEGEAAAEPASLVNERRPAPVFTFLAIPEPGSALLTVGGLLAIAALRRRARRE